MKINLILENRPYPGRGIIMGRSSDREKAVIAYFLMGRSANSRNRILVEDDVDIRAQAFDESLVADPSLIIYSPVKILENRIIVTNGNQTDTIARLMNEDNLSFQQALDYTEFEPDAPYYTPRISSVMDLHNFNYQLSIVKTADSNPDSCSRFLYSYEAVSGKGHFIHTYDNDTQNLPSFSGEPYTVDIGDNIDTFTNMIWESLNENNKVSLFTCYIHMKNRVFESRIMNKNEST